MSTLSQFHLFPLLPTELRLKIWSHALPPPRTIPINCTKGFTPQIPPRRYVISFTTPLAPPSILHTCAESRSIGLETYTPLFRTQRSEKYIYISISSDTVSLSEALLTYISPEEVSKLQRLKVEVHDYLYFGHYHIDTIFKMKSLQLLEIGGRPAVDHGSAHYIESSAEPVYLAREFRQRKVENPEWCSPEIRIGGLDGRDDICIEGGALGVVPEDGDELDVVLS